MVDGQGTRAAAAAKARALKLTAERRLGGVQAVQQRAELVLAVAQLSATQSDHAKVFGRSALALSGWLNHTFHKGTNMRGTPPTFSTFRSHWLSVHRTVRGSDMWR